MKVAVIGAGIAGLSCAHELAKHGVEVDLYEKEPQLGGHAYTHSWRNQGQLHHVDCGFLVYNEHNYPNFTRLLNDLKVETCKSDMSFSYDNPVEGWNYLGQDILDLFHCKRTALNPAFYRMLYDMLRFNRFVNHYVQHGSKRMVTDYQALTLNTMAEFKRNTSYSEVFWQHYLSPMLAAIWTCARQQVYTMPSDFVLRFMYHHGLTRVLKRPKWRTIRGGSKHYVEAIARHPRIRALLCSQVQKLSEQALSGQRSLSYMQSKQQLEAHYHYVVFACHPRHAAACLGANHPARTHLLACQYNPTAALLHRDIRLLPTKSKRWGSWNYMRHVRGDYSSYYLNKLQPLNVKYPLILSINPPRDMQPRGLITKLAWEHPYFNAAFLSSRNKLKRYQGHENIYFCGAYLGFGFHEDGCRSGLQVAQQILGDIKACSTRSGMVASVTTD